MVSILQRRLFLTLDLDRFFSSFRNSINLFICYPKLRVVLFSISTMSTLRLCFSMSKLNYLLNGRMCHLKLRNVTALGIEQNCLPPKPSPTCLAAWASVLTLGSVRAHFLLLCSLFTSPSFPLALLFSPCLSASSISFSDSLLSL